ncbi:MAG TPA: pyridoxamine 5'-phosphate oxidase family protein [Streptosporangiaceae bacterium]|nr:pyridoxamine 5'-phosphate oxidase family protein [Streptosporangiaceae bacterium]
MVTSTGHGGTDLGRRIREHREKANLSTEEAAAGAGMATSYLTYLETSPDASPTPAAVARLASSLGTTVHAITGVGMDLPPGRQPLEGCPVLEVLSVAECRAFLDDGGVGRFLFSEARGPVAVPVNFAMFGDDIVFLTTADMAASAADGRETVSFEVDHLDEALAEGWSVLASGHAHTVTGAGELAEAASLHITPWAGGTRDTYVRLVPAVLTGRRIRASG